MGSRNLPSWEELKSFKLVHAKTINGIEQETVHKALVYRLVINAHKSERMENLPVLWKDEVTKEQYEAYYQRYLNIRKPQLRGLINEQRGFSFLLIDDGDLDISVKRMLFDEGEDEDN